MKNRIKILNFDTPPVSTAFLLIFGLFLMFGTPSCRTKSGCPTKEYHSKIGRNGEPSTKRGKTNLFPKEVRKKMKSK